jgi:hypothetical protein
MAFPGTYNINYYKGDRYEFVIYPKDAAGDVFDLDGYNSAFSIASSTGPDPEEGPFAASAVINNAKDRVTCVILPEVGKDNLDAGTIYYYDVQISSGTDVVYTLLKGTITVTADVTGA